MSKTGKIKNLVYTTACETEWHKSVPLVDIRDRVIGFKPKYAAHSINILGKCDLHRAFSVFLFDTKNRLVLQRRSDFKKTFPLYLSNTCCSHPGCTDRELDERNQIGIKLSAIDRLKYELGISDNINPDELLLVSRLRYYARSSISYGENEIDYCMLIKKDVKMEPNPAEVDEVIYTDENDLKDLLKNDDITPWFKYICENYLPEWWDKIRGDPTAFTKTLPDIIDAGNLTPEYKN